MRGGNHDGYGGVATRLTSQTDVLTDRTDGLVGRQSQQHAGLERGRFSRLALRALRADLALLALRAGPT